MSIGFRIDVGSILGILLLTATTTTTFRRTTFSTTTAAAAAAAAAATIAPAPPPTQNVDGEIKDINVNVTLHDRRVLQLQVLWTDTLATGVSYNVIVNPVNAKECPDMPCSVFGIGKPTRSLLIPDQPMSYVEPMECNYMFGCNYTLTVETSNAHVQRSIPLPIPDCVAGVCSCQHAANLPKVNIPATNIPASDTINLLWSIHAAGPNDVLALKAMNISLKISEQTNPTLSWGGKHISIIKTMYNISALNTLQTNGSLKGNIQVKVRQQLASNAMLHVQASIVDQRDCAGPENFQRVRVPVFNERKETVEVHDNHLRTGLVIVSVFFICTLSAGLIAGMVVCRRRSKSTHGHLPREGDYTSPLTMVEMEDNINYVDKDVEEAQAKGLADIFEVPHHAIQMGPEIGEGAFGRVYKATAYNLRRMRGATLVAVKQLKKNPTADEVAEFLGEIEMLKAVGTHHNIVCFLGCVTIRPPYMMLMEFVGRGDLLSYLRTVRYELSKRHMNNTNTNNTSANCNNVSSANTNNVSNSNSNSANTNTAPSSHGGAGTTVKYIELQMSEQSIDSDCTDAQQTRQPMPSFAETMYTIIEDDDYKHPEFLYVLDHKELHNFAMQIANGMRFLEEQQITHRDLAARNVLIDDYKTLKISDFGLSRHGIYTNTKKRKLPLRWLSIEAIRDNVYSSKSDVWAYGVVLWEIGTLGASPYPTISNHELIPFLMSGKRLDKPDICTEQVYALMMQCWDDDPMQRPSFEELFRALSPRTVYVDASNLSDDYVFPPIKDTDTMR